MGKAELRGKRASRRKRPRSQPIGRVVCALVLLILVLSASLAHAIAHAAAYLGVASCAGSTCHGRSEGNGKVVRQDELAILQDGSSAAGAHARAYAVLASPRGQRIAATLGLGPASSAPACLGCHASNAPQGLRGPRYRTADGIGCETCHGPASAWISAHYALPASHASNLALGMTALDNPQVRARVCLDCHYGSAEAGQFVTHAMMAAGHPRIAFELDLFSALQAHYDLDADYTARKRRPDSVQLWAVGQAEAVRRQASLFARPDLASEGLFPQFTFFDCHSCHRAIRDSPEPRRTFEDNPARPIPFANPPFNDENMILLSLVASLYAPGEAARYETAARGFHRAMGQGAKASGEAASALSSAAASLSDRLAARSFAPASAFDAVAAVAARTTSARFTDYAGSAQAVMAIDTLLNALVREGRVTVGAAAGIRARINRAYEAVAAPERYDPPTFRRALGEAARAIAALR